MIDLATVFGARHSLQRRLVLNVVLALLVCLLMATVILIREFYDHLDENAKAALLQEAAELAASLDPAAPDFGLDAAALRFSGDTGAYRYTVFDARWTPPPLLPPAAAPPRRSRPDGRRIPGSG